MRTPTLLTVIVSAALLGACATPYKPKSAMNNGGYSETRRAPGVYQVWFLDEYITGQRGEDLALLRAADLCLGEGKAFMRTSDFQHGILRVRESHNIVTTRTYETGDVKGEPHVPVQTSNDMHLTEGRQMYTTRSGLLVTCLAEKSGDTQESAIVAASIRQRYAISTRSTPRTPSR